RFDLLVVPPYTIHQHGGDSDLGCQIYVPQSRMIETLGLMVRGQHMSSEKPSIPEGTEPLRNAGGVLIGYRIKKGVLGITEDVDVLLGAEPNVESAFEARRQAG